MRETVCALSSHSLQSTVITSAALCVRAHASPGIGLWLSMIMQLTLCVSQLPRPASVPATDLSPADCTAAALPLTSDTVLAV